VLTTTGPSKHTIYTWIGAQLTATQPTDLFKQVPGCKPLDSYYHPLRVVNKHIMGIRKQLAKALTSTAHILESDKSKEYITAKVNVYRTKLAILVMPKDN
jgi:hypothetical protein